MILLGARQCSKHNRRVIVPHLQCLSGGRPNADGCGEHGGPSLVCVAPGSEALCVNENRGQRPRGPRTGMFTQTQWHGDLAAGYANNLY